MRWLFTEWSFEGDCKFDESSGAQLVSDDDEIGRSQMELKGNESRPILWISYEKIINEQWFIEHTK